MSSYELQWGVKNSFVRYVRAMADGICTPSGGAQEAPGGAFVFPSPHPEPGPPPEPAPPGAMTWRFTGELHFGAHGGVLGVVIADPWIILSETTAELTIVDDARPSARIVFATGHRHDFARDGDGVGFLWPAPFLSDRGAMIFHDAYPEGTALDPVLVRPGR
jgi:hypothetical protein